MTPLRGPRRDAPACGPVVQAPLALVHTPDGTPSLVADCARDRENTRPQLFATRLPWSPRVPAPVSDVPVALDQAAPQTIAPLRGGYRDRRLASTSGAGAPRPRHPTCPGGRRARRRAGFTGRCPSGTRRPTPWFPAGHDRRWTTPSFRPRSDARGTQAQGRRKAACVSSRPHAS
jgi:hypothetical protein